MTIVKSEFGTWAHCSSCDSTLAVGSCYCRHCGNQVTEPWSLDIQWNQWVPETEERDEN